MGRRIVTFALAGMLATAITPMLRGAAPVWNPATADSEKPPALGLPASPYNVSRPTAPVVSPTTRLGAGESGDEPTIQPVQAVTPPPQAKTDADPRRIDPTPGAPGGALTLEPPTFESPTIPLPNVSTRKLKFGNRSASPTNAKYLNMPNGEQIALITGGIKLLAEFQDKGGLILDVEADQLVIWQTGGKAQDLVGAMGDREGATVGDDKQIELYMTGNVVIRYGTLAAVTEDKVLRAKRVYYDVSKNKAIAISADLEMVRPGLPVPAHFTGARMEQLSAEQFVIKDAVGAASKLPADPGFDLHFRELRITEEKNQLNRTVFGTPVVNRFTGEQDVSNIKRFYARNTFLELADVPVFWFPVLSGDAADPTGPLQNFVYRQDRIFGSQFLTTWSILELIGVKKLPGERWDLMTDYLSVRGPALGTVYDLAGDQLFGYNAPFTTHVLAYGIYDKGHDQLAGTRDLNWDPPGFRGRAYWRHVQEYDDFSFQGQVAYLSDANFLEQYYKYEFDMGPNQETFAYLKYQHASLAATLLVEPNLDRPFVTETQWLPRAQGFLLGESFFDRLTYNTWGSIGYANLQVYNLPANQLSYPGAPTVTETPLNTGRIDWMQNLSMPLTLGPAKVVPYLVGDLAYYTQDNEGNSRGRAYGGYGVRGSIPLSRLYDDVQSDLFNVKGLFHKMTFGANYYSASADTPLNMLPQLDRLNDDSTQEAIRDITPWQQVFYPGPTGVALANSPMYNPRLYALRRLVDTSADNLDTIQVLQGEWRQRWQTKRGYEGMEHTVDYFTLDLSASFFPAPNRDNFGHPVSFIEYSSSWAIGDRNGFLSTGWFDPYTLGTHYWNVLGYFNRPDGTNYTLGYRSFEPLGSHLVTASVAYTFSPKYGVNLYTAYDFGISKNESIGLNLVRTGTDLTWSVGFSYNALINNFGFNFMVIPNLMATKGGMNPFQSAGGMMGRN